MKQQTRQIIVALALLLSMAACAAMDISEAKRTSGRDPTVAEIPDKDETVRGDTDPAIVTLDLGSALHERRLSGGEDLPGSIIIPTTNLTGVPITAALQAVLTGTDVSLSWDTGALGDRLVNVMNLSGPLPKVVEKICASARVFCDYRHGSLELSEKETFVVGLPPVAKAVTGSSSSNSSNNSAGSSNSMIEAISQLTGTKVQVDEQGGNLIYTTSVDGEDKVGQYLARLRTGRPLVVLQMYIWEVTLSKENAQGINWSQLNLEKFMGVSLSGTNALASAASTTGSVSLGAVTTGRISSTVIASFLATKGLVQTISNPQITFVSGSSAELKVGGTQRYISQVGTLTSTANVSGTTNSNTGSNASTNTVSTDSIDTGLTVDVAGTYENGVVFANLNMTLKNLVGLNPTTSGGGTIDLPETTDESMNTVLRVRPGDSLVMAGLVTSADTRSHQNLLSDDGLPLYGDDQAKNHELVIIVKPSVVLFSETSVVEEAKKKETAKPLPDAVIIDKDGSHDLVLPKRGVPQALAVPEPAAIRPQPVVAQTPTPQPELMYADPNATPLSNTVFAPGQDNAPVDRRLMQRGFSHAFDDLLRPDDVAASNEAHP